eukprot:scaffold28982_cov136-Isochrysis_galbana.AAC.1
MWDGAKGVGSVAEPRHEDRATVRDKRGHSSTFRGALEFCRPRRCSLERCHRQRRRHLAHELTVVERLAHEVGET